MIAHLELADYLAIAERVLGLPAEVVANFDRIGLAESKLTFATGSRPAAGDSARPAARRQTQESPYWSPYESFLLCLMRLPDVLDERE